MEGSLGHRFTAGFAVLTKFQDQWTRIHSKSEKNISKAQQTLMKIDQLDKSLSERQAALGELKNSHMSLAKIQNQVDRLAEDMKTLEGCFEKIEDLLIVMKNHKETSDTEIYIENLENDYVARVADLNATSQARKNKMKYNHLKRVEEYEREQQKEFEERRQILERAFEEEKTLYLRKTGS